MYIKVEGLSKKYKDEYVLKDINLSLEKNNIYGFIGTNGSGKTMLLKAIAGLIIPTEGEIYIKNEKLHKNISFPDDMGLIIEGPSFLDYLSGYDNLEVLAKIKNKIDKNTIMDTLKLVGLDPNSKKIVKKYSLGMKQRLGIAQALMEDPELLILDEPFNALDEEGVKEIRDLLLSMKERGKIILLTSHNQEDIDILCDKIFKIKAGKII